MPLNSQAKLVENILDLKSLEQKPTRDGYGFGLVEAADKNPNVVMVLLIFVMIMNVGLKEIVCFTAIA